MCSVVQFQILSFLVVVSRCLIEPKDFRYIWTNTELPLKGILIPFRFFVPLVLLSPAVYLATV